MKRRTIVIFAILTLLCAMCLSLAACKHSHEWASEWKNDETYHWHECTKNKCTEVGNKEEHTFEQMKDNDYHWQKCTTCEYIKDKNSHNYNDDNICVDCGNKHNHTIKYDDTNHWYACQNVCDISQDKVPHNFVKGECDFCGFKKGSESLVYSLNSDGESYSVTGVGNNFENLATDIVISEYYNGKPVTTIDKRAFYSKIYLENVYIPKTIETIKERAFSGCVALAEIYIPSSVNNIEDNVFENCYGITIKAQAQTKPTGWNTSDWKIVNSAYYPVVWDADNNNVAENGYIYFVDKERGNVKYGIKGNKAVVAKQPITTNNIELKPAVLYGDEEYYVTEIEDYAFYMNDVITDIEIQRFTTRIGNYAFYKCTNLNEINWRKNNSEEIVVDIKEIGVCAFAECSRLSQFVIPQTLTKLGAGMLQGCDNITKITIPKTVTNVEDYAFSGCSKLVIKCEAESKPNGWKNNWNDSNRPVIWNCDINSNTTADGKIILENEGVVTYLLNTIDKTGEVIYQNNIANVSVATISETTRYNNNVYAITKLGNNLFAGNEKLVTIELPSSIKQIGAGALAQCLLLETIKFAGTIEEWKAIEKGEGWNFMTDNYVVKCSNGTLDKQGNVIG